MQNSSNSIDRLSQSIFDAQIDLNPHQVEASLFAFQSPLQNGVILADEVGLGKTIEAGLVLCQYWSERRRKIIIIAPASLRKQWSMELKEKFFIESIIIDGETFKEEVSKGNKNPFIQKDKVVITSYPFASKKEEFIFLAGFNLAILDEAHKLRNFHKGDKAKQAYSINQSLRETKKVLLTATPLQNSLLEIYGLVSLIDPFVFGDKKAFSKQFSNGTLTTSDVNDLKDRLKPIVHRTLRNDETYKTKKLKVLKVKEGKDYKREEKIFFKFDDNQYIVKKVILNLYNQIDVMESLKGSNTKVDYEESKFSEKHFAFLNIDNIYFELQRYKNERNWFNLSIEKDVIKDFFNSNNWYKLLCPKTHIEIKKFDDYKKIEEIVIALLKQYIKAFYEYNKSDWEKDYLEFQYLSESDSNLISEYKVEVEDTETALIEQLKKLEIELKAHKELKIDTKSFKSIFFDKHLYNPLIFKGKGLSTLKIKPVHLNEGEIEFIEDLEKFLTKYKSQLEDKEIYLLRNQSKTGIGVFTEVNFYPDFLMWILHDDIQYINFIDPKGLVNLNTKDDPKINFSSKIKEIETQIGDGKTILNSFIVSVTEFQVLDWTQGGDKQDLENRNVLFQKDDKDIYINTMFKKILG